MNYDKYLFFDIESCNGQIHDASMCSFGYVITDKEFNILEQKDIIMNPMAKKFNVRGEFGGIELSYSEEEFRASPTFDKHYETIKALFSDCLAFGFAIRNDVNYLNNACDEYRLTRFEYEYLDVQQIASTHFGDKNQIGLKRASEHFEIEFVEHRSDEDARVTMLVLAGILKEQGLDLDGIVQKYGITFGHNTPMSSNGTTMDLTKEVALSTMKSKKILLHEFKESIVRRGGCESNPKLRGRRVYIDMDIACENVDKTRSALQKLVDVGGKFCNGLKQCTLYVSNKLQTAEYEGRTIDVITSEQFFELLGDLPELKFNDWKTLKDHKRKVTVARYRKQAMEAKNKKQTD